jgi:antitoxin HicB
VARELGADKEAVERALAARPRSADQHGDTALAEGAQDALDVSDDRLSLASAFEVLDERERQIVYQRFVRDRSRSQVAQELGISERHLSRQTQVALAKLRKQLERAGQEIAPRDRSGTADMTAQPRPRPASAGPVPRRPSPKVAIPRPRRNDRDLPHRISIVRDHESDQGHEWTAHAEELPGCEAHGDSLEEAVRRIDDAVEEWIEDALAKGREVPDPRTAASYSGRLMLRMPRSLHAELSEAAEREGVSLNQFIANSLERSLDAPVGAPGEVVDDDAGEGRQVPGLLRLAIIVNLIVVLVAAVVAVVILVVASQQGW